MIPGEPLTTPLTLFDDFERDDGRRRGHVSEFEFLNRSAWPACEKMRIALEDWFATYPDADKPGLRARFRKRDDNHESAMFELLLHQIFRQLNLAPQVHPQLPTGGGKPDFLITDRSGNSYYVEAKVAMGTASRVPPNDAREAEILDAIGEIVLDRPTDVVLNVTTTGELAGSQRRRPIQNQVRRWLTAVEPQEIPADGGAWHCPRLHICRGEWTLTLTAVRVAERKSRTPVIIFSGGGFPDYRIDTMLKSSIDEKARKYRPDHPLIVAIHARHATTGRGHYEDALFRAPLGRGRIPDAVWRLGSEPRYPYLHGVTFVGGFLPYGMAHTFARTYTKPSADGKLPEELLQLGSARVQDGQVIYENGLRLGEVLGLSEDWPGPASMPSDSPLSISDREGAMG